VGRVRGGEGGYLTVGMKGGAVWLYSKHTLTVNVDFLRIEYMVLAKYQHMSILELILLVKQHILILCKNLLGVDVLIIVN
jgi:hypothetical protein